jgi:photosystem II stability/assembly factor-like uncharacterized protein
VKRILLISILSVIVICGCGKSSSDTVAKLDYPMNCIWHKVGQIKEGEVYQDLFFVDESNGWAVGELGKIYHSSDGGSSWTLQESGTDYDLHCVYFANDQQGLAGGSYNTILMTKDGGVSWVLVNKNDNQKSICMDMYFVDDGIGWVVDNYGGIMHTQDGGKTWTRQISGTHWAITSVHFIDTLEGWATATNCIILHTTDGGMNWSASEIRFDFPRGPAIFEDIFFLDKRNGWISTSTMASSTAGYTTPLLRTTDGGDTWFVQSAVPDLFSSNVCFINQNIGWLEGMRGVCITMDGGKTWNSQLEEDDDDLFVAISHSGSSHVWVLDHYGTIYEWICQN